MKGIEFDTVVYLNKGKNSKEDKQSEYLKELGIEANPEEEDTSKEEERVVSYFFAPDKIIEVRETFTLYEDEWVDSVFCTYMAKGEIFSSLTMLCSMKEFKTQVNEYFKEKNNLT